MDTQPTWTKIAESVSEIVFNEKNLSSFFVNGHKICVIKTEEGLRACTDRCPHAGGSLSEGYLDHKHNIVCCVHNYKFNLRTGRDPFNEGYFLKLYPVLVNEEGVFVSVK